MRPTETEYFVLNNTVGAASEIERLRRDFDIEIEVNGVLRRKLAEALELLREIVGHRQAVAFFAPQLAGVIGALSRIDAVLAATKKGEQ